MTEIAQVLLLKAEAKALAAEKEAEEARIRSNEFWENGKDGELVSWKEYDKYEAIKKLAEELRTKADIAAEAAWAEAWNNTLELK